MTSGLGKRSKRRLARTSLLLLIILTSLIIFASAAIVTITNASKADYAGYLIKPYYEDLNAPVTGCTSPCLTVDTQTTEPSSSSATLSLDGSATGTWSSGTSFTITATTAHPNDVIVLWVVTYISGSSITVSSISDSQGKVVWQGSARTSYISCSHKEETTQTEWYGTASTALSSDVITVTLGGAPTAASGEEFAVTGANTASPFDINANLPATVACSTSTAAPTVSTLSTSNANDFVFALYGGYTSTVETAGAIAGTTATVMQAIGGTGDSLAGEYLIVSSTEASQSCAYSLSTNYWGIVCDAIVQATNSFSLPGGSSMYLWSPQFGSATSIPAGALSLQLFADLPTPALDGSSSGTWASGRSFQIGSFTTIKANDVVVLSIQTYSSGASVTVSSVTDSLTAVSWKSSARQTLVSCTGTQESTLTEWYGTAASAVTSDTITVSLSATPISASGIAFGVSGADTTTPFDPASGLPKTAVSGCTAGVATPSVSAVSTAADTDFALSLFGGYTSVTETAGTIGGTTASLINAVAGTGDSNAAEYATTAAALSSTSCSYGTSTTYWGIICDALMPARQTITISYATTNSAGTVQSSMISGSAATITAVYQPISLVSTAGGVPASGYIRVTITAPSGTALAVSWGAPKPTLFEIETTVKT
jgi:hypothetical protein